MSNTESTTSHAHANPAHEEEPTMSAPKKKTTRHRTNHATTNTESAMSKPKTTATKKKSHHATATETLTSTEPAMSTPTAATKAASPVTGSTPAVSSSAASGAPAPGSAGTGPAGFIAPPPPLDPSRNPPTGFVAETTADYRGVVPRNSELNALPMALKDLTQFSDYALVLGGTVPPLAQVLVAFAVTHQWSASRTQSVAWDAYCRDQEGIAWSMLRPILDRLKPAFALALLGDPTIKARFPGLVTLLDAQKAIAQKGVATKKANREAQAVGEPASHGKVGKAATKRAAKAALVAARAAAAAPTTAPVVESQGTAAATAVTAGAPPGTGGALGGAANGGH
jgi:hypothetical protein